MNKEELFCKLFPEYAVNGKPLSPYFDLFESGFEQAEKRIEELEQTNKQISYECHKLVNSLEKKQKEVVDLEKENAELKAFRQDCVKLTEDNVVMARQRAEIARKLTNAKEIIKKLKALYLSPVVTKDDVKRQGEILSEAEQFISEVEK